MSSPRTLPGKCEEVISPLCAGHRVPIHKLNCCGIDRQCSHKGSPFYLRAWNLLCPAQGSFSGPHIARSTVRGSKWTSRCPETSKLTQRWDLSVLSPSTGVYVSVLLSFLLSVGAGIVGTDSFLGQGMLLSSTALPFLGCTDTWTSSSMLETSCLPLLVALRSCPRPGFSHQ